MADALTFAVERAKSGWTMLARLGVRGQGYLLVTIHRAENTDDASRLGNVLRALDALEGPLLFPVHPRTRKAIEALGHRPAPHVRLLEPLGYLDMVQIEESARMILTDSGGVQKEAYWLGVPCVTLRDETEWVQTVQAGWNVLAGADAARIARVVGSFVVPPVRPPLYGGGAAERICKCLSMDRHSITGGPKAYGSHR